MFPSRHPKPRKHRFLPWLELLEKREVLDAALRFSIQQITVSESQTAVPVTIVVELSEPSQQPVEFFCNLIPGSATEEVDFHAHREHFIIPAGKTSLVVPLAHIYEDQEHEDAETLSFELTSVDGTAIQGPLLDSEGNPLDNPGLVTIMILDNDLPPLPESAGRGLIEPGRLAAGQEHWQTGPLGISLADGTAYLSESLGPVTLTYSGATVTNLTAQLRYYFEQTPPSEFAVRLSFQGNTTETVYTGSTLTGNEEVRLGMQIPVQGLPTGRYAYSLEVVSDGTTLQSYSGNMNWVNRAGSEYGAGWGLAGVEEIVPQSGGVLLIQGNGTSLWYAEGAVLGSYLAAAGDSATLARNNNGSFTRTTHSGEVTEFDSAGRMLSQTDRSGNSTTFGRDATGLLTTITNPFGQVTTLAYTQGKLASVTDPAGRVIQISQSNGNLTTITNPDPDGSGPLPAPATTLGYDVSHRLTVFTDSRGKSTQVTYDGRGKVASVSQPDGSITQIRSAQSQTLPVSGTGTTLSPALPLLAVNYQAEVTDGRDNLWKTELDTLGFGLAVSRVDPLGNTTVLERNSQGWLTSITDPLQRRVTFTLDAHGNILTLALPDGATTTFAYNSFGQLTQRVEPDVNLEDEVPGPTTTWVYDSTGNLVQQLLPDEDANTGNNPVESFTYDSHGLLLASTDARGFTTSFQRDSLGRVVQATYPDDNSNPADNPKEAFTYDLWGNIATSTDEMGFTTLYNHDLLGNLTQIVRPDMNSNPSDNPVESFTYDGAGNQLTQTDALGNATLYSYDNLNRMQSVTSPDPDGAGPLSAAVTSFTHDAAGNLTKVVDPLGRASTWGYDEANRMTGKTRGSSWSEEYGYDGAGQMVRYAGPAPDADAPQARFEQYKTYNPQGKVISTSDSMMGLQESQFNAWGDLVGFT